MEQEYNYNNTDYDDEFTYVDLESKYKLVEEDGLLIYKSFDQEFWEDENRRELAEDEQKWFENDKKTFDEDMDEEED